MGKIGCERSELRYVFSIPQVKPAAVNEGLREQWKTTNEERESNSEKPDIYSGKGAFRY